MNEEEKSTQLTITVGDQDRFFQGGNMLNALDELVCYFLETTEMDSIEMAKLIAIYAEELPSK